MAAAIEPFLLSVRQFLERPQRADAVEELHWGLVVPVTFPKKKHTRIQTRLFELLGPHALNKGFLAAEFPFRAIPEYDLRSADVAFVSQQRWDATDENDNLHGAPDLAIEVLSPSNTAAELREKAALCLANGAEEFWLMNPDRQIVTVMRREEGPIVYGSPRRIPLRLLQCEISVADVLS